MKTLNCLLAGSFVLGMVLAAPVGASAGNHAVDACHAAYVTQNGTVITVSPTGVDDTDNIQCAFDAAVAAGPGTTVKLVEGTYHTQQIVVNDFVGIFTGAGAENTIVMNLPNLYVTPVDTFLNPPGPDNPWPSLFAFVNGDFLVSELAIHITGETPTTGWSVPGIPLIRELADGITIDGTNANASFYRLLIEGEEAENTIFGFNLINGFFYEGLIGAAPPPISGSFAVHDSIFRRLASGTPIVNLSGASVVISRNTFEDVFFGMDGGDVENTTFVFSHNKVNALVGLDLYDAGLAPFGAESSNILIKNNVFRGQYGPIVEPTFSGGTDCLLLGNNVQKVSELGNLLGPGTSHCTVVGGSNKTNVLDLGTDNVLVGVNNMGSGVGPTIRTFLKMMKNP